MILILEARSRALSGLARGLEAAGHQVTVAHHVELHSMKAVRAAVAEVKPSAVISTGGMEDPLQCEEDPARAFVLNAEGAIHLAAAALEFRAVPIAISTAAVLGDRGGEHGEEAAPDPRTTYAKSKHQGETFLLRSPAAKRALVLRVGHVFEDGLGSERARLADTVEASERELVSAVGAFDLGTAIDRLLGAAVSGVVHVAAPDAPVSELELWRAIAGACGADARVSASFRKGGAALVCGRLEALGVRLRPWRDALADAASRAAPVVEEPVLALAAGGSIAGQGPVEIAVRTGKIVIEEREDRIVKAGQSARVEGSYRIMAIEPSEIIVH